MTEEQSSFNDDGVMSIGVKLDLKSPPDKPTIKRDLNDPNVAGRYTPEDDTIHLNPELEDVTTLSEEYYHRRQDIILNNKGATEAERNTQLYLTALEIGIIPTIRDIGVRNRIDSANFEFFRYCTEAQKFATAFQSATEAEQNRFKQHINKERLFDGLAWVLSKVEDEHYDPKCWEDMAVSDPSGEHHWEEISASRKKFVQ